MGWENAGRERNYRRGVKKGDCRCPSHDVSCAGRSEAFHAGRGDQTMSDTSQQMDVSLDTFEGPLDLLLHLIKKSDLEISNIPIAQITHEYLGYLDLMKDLNLEMAGEFLVMASTLMQIKAQMLLPAPAVSDEDNGPDPRTELMNKLMEYQRFKEAAGVLTIYKEKAKDIYYRHVPPQFDHD